MRTGACAWSAIAALAILAVGQPLAPHAQTAVPSAPPVAATRPVIDDYFGTTITDPYRYMESLSDPGVQAWFTAEDAYARAVLARPQARAQLVARIRQPARSGRVVDAGRLSGNRFLIFKSGPENAGRIYIRQGPGGPDRLLIDVDAERIPLQEKNKAKGRGAVGEIWMSEDLKYAAVTIIPGGAENDTELHVIETATGRETGDVILRAVGQETGFPAWLPDNRSFVYGRYQRLPPGAAVTEEQEKYRTYLHVLGTDPERDQPVFGFGVTPSIDVDPRLFATVQLEPGSKYALGVLTTDVSPANAFYITAVDSLGRPDASWRKVADFADQVKRIAVHGDDLYLLTFKDAARYKVLRTSARTPDLASAEIVLPQSDSVITALGAAQDALYVRLRDGNVGRLLRVPYGPRPLVESIPLPFQGSLIADTNLRLPGALITGHATDRALGIYAYDPEKKRVSDTRIQAADPESASVESVDVKVPSHDGTLVPLSIRSPRGLKLDGSNPTLLYGYGAYGFSTNADPTGGAWVELGGVSAVCHVRGGGELGETWHLAGKGLSKPNTWLDFIACAEYLVSKKYTSPARLAGMGASAGGILIGRAITERPDLFDAAIIEVGMLDMLRSETTANGMSNIPEFGSTKSADGFNALLAMSAYHHVSDHTAYPAVLLTTGFNDPRVDSWEPGKMAARLQAATTSGKPVLLRVDFAGGHGIGDTPDQRLERLADEMSFLLWQAGVPAFQPRTP